METKIGPIKATFNGEVEISDLNPPHGYTLSGRGSAGSMGNARGSAKVKLIPDDSNTKLAYEVDAEVTGKFVQLGSQATAGARSSQGRKRRLWLLSLFASNGGSWCSRERRLPSSLTF